MSLFTVYVGGARCFECWGGETFWLGVNGVCVYSVCRGSRCCECWGVETFWLGVNGVFVCSVCTWARCCVSVGGLKRSGWE